MKEYIAIHHVPLPGGGVATPGEIIGADKCAAFSDGQVERLLRLGAIRAQGEPMVCSNTAGNGQNEANCSPDDEDDKSIDGTAKAQENATEGAQSNDEADDLTEESDDEEAPDDEGELDAEDLADIMIDASESIVDEPKEAPKAAMPRISGNDGKNSRRKTKGGSAK